jgi:Neuraminidase (sialidase)
MMDDAYYPKIYSNINGKVVVVWQNLCENQFRIKAISSSDFGKTWSSTINISEMSCNSFSPCIDMNLAGNAVIVFSALINDVKCIQESYSPDFGLTWSIPQVISDIGEYVVSP